MDSFENTPNTIPAGSEQVVATNTPEPVPATPQQNIPQKASPKKNYLEIGILLVILAILAGLITWYFVSRNQTISVPQESDTTDQANAGTTTQPTLVVVTPTMEPRELKVLADCKMHNVSPEGLVTVLYENEELCDYRNRIIYETENYIQVWNDRIYKGTRKLMKVSDGSLINFPDDLKFGYYHPTSNTVYSTTSGANSVTLYKGPLTNLKAQEIFEFELTMGGRGSMTEDDFYFVPNYSEKYVIYQDTTTVDFLTDSTDELSISIGSLYGGMAVFASNGSKLLEQVGAFRTRWISDNSFVTLVKNEENTHVTLRKYTISADGKYTYVDMYLIEDKANFGEIYNIDIYNETALLNVVINNKHYAYKADLSGDTTALVKYSEIPANASIIGTGNLLGFGLVPCDPSQDLGSDGNLVCPVEWIFSDYKTDVRLYNIKTKETKTLLEFEEMYLL